VERKKGRENNMPQSPIDTLNINASDLIRELCIQIRFNFNPMFKFRMWLGKKIIILGCKITGCKVEVID
jgi:hypothetical protein